MKLPLILISYFQISQFQIDSGNGSTYLTEAGYYCHEKWDLILPVLDSVSFWIEGVSLTIVAFVGLLGNLLTVIVLPKLDRGQCDQIFTLDG